MKIPFSLVLALLVSVLHGSAAQVDVIRTPGGGIQPQAAVGADGTLHLVYYRGEPAGGDLFYVKRVVGASEFSRPIQVNNIGKSAASMGTIRGAHMSLGRNDRVHVAWMGSSATAAPAGEGGHPEYPMFYTRSSTDGATFEPERNIMTWTGELDGGGSVAADAKGNVFVAWHGSAPGNVEGETGRAMFVAVSADDGETFAREVQANAEPTGSCGCCGMRAFVDADDELHLLYRAANPISRDMTLLSSSDQGRTFTTRTVNRWNTQSCPMSSSVMADADGALLLATEAADLVECNRLDEGAAQVRKFATASSAKSKHPAIAANKSGEILIAWAEGASWGKGGQLNWRLFDGNGKPVGEVRSVGELPAWSFPCAIATPDGNFLVVY